MASLRRERIDEILERLLAVIGLARGSRDAFELDALTTEFHASSADEVRYAQDRDPDAGTMSAASIAIDTARKTLTESRERFSGR